MKYTQSDKELICKDYCLITSNGNKIYRHVCDSCVDCDVNEYEVEYCTDIYGNKIDCPDLSSVTECLDKDNLCHTSKSLYTVIDNTGTRFNWTAEIELSFTDGTTTVVTQTPQSGWSNQLLHWNDIFGSALESKCNSFVIESRCNILPNGCGGLLPPPTFLQTKIPNMKWRYLQLTTCADCITINGASVISVNGQSWEQLGWDTPRPLVLNFISGEQIFYETCSHCSDEELELYYYGTKDIVDEADYPICLKPCNYIFPKSPDARCTVDTEDLGCDNNNSTNTSDWVTDVTRVIFNCDGELSVVYFRPDPNDPNALIEYTLVGQYVDCNTGGIIIEPEPVVVLDEIVKDEICINNLDGTYTTAWEVKSILTDGTLEVTYEDETGVIPKPTNFTIGKCKKGECQPCCSATVSTNRGGIQDPRNSNYTSTNFNGDTWTEFISNGEALGYTITLTSIGGGNTSTLTICGEEQTINISYTLFSSGGNVNVELECEKCEAEIVKLCSEDLAQLTPIEPTPDKDYIVVCDEEGNQFLQCINNATGDVSTIDFNGQTASEECVEITRNCANLEAERTFTDQLTRFSINGNTTNVPNNWTSLSLTDRISFFEGLLPTGATYDNERVCNDTSFPINLFYGRLITRIIWTTTTVIECTGTEPVGELGACEDSNYSIEDEVVCSSVAGTLTKLVIYNNGTLENTLYLDGIGNVITDLGVVTIGECKITKKCCLYTFNSDIDYENGEINVTSDESDTLVSFNSDTDAGLFLIKLEYIAPNGEQHRCTHIYVDFNIKPNFYSEFSNDYSVSVNSLEDVSNLLLNDSVTLSQSGSFSNNIQDNSLILDTDVAEIFTDCTSICDEDIPLTIGCNDDRRDKLLDNIIETTNNRDKLLQEIIDSLPKNIEVNDLLLQDANGICFKQRETIINGQTDSINYFDLSNNIISVPPTPYIPCSNNDFFIDKRTYCIFTSGSKYEITENTTYIDGQITDVTYTNNTTGESPYVIPNNSQEVNCRTPQYNWKCLYERTENNICDTQGDGFVNYERWEGQSGTSLSNANFNVTPTFTGTLSSIETPTNIGDNLTSRISGWFKAPVSGQYTIAIASDNQGELRISTDDNPVNLSTVPIVNVLGWTPPRVWNRYSGQQSNITLEACNWYYFEAISKEGGGGDNLAIGWILPNSNSIEVINTGLSSIQPISLSGTTCIPVRERTTQYEGSTPILDYFIIENGQYVSYEPNYNNLSETSCDSQISITYGWRQVCLNIDFSPVKGYVQYNVTTGQDTNIYKRDDTGEVSNSWSIRNICDCGC